MGKFGRLAGFGAMALLLLFKPVLADENVTYTYDSLGRLIGISTTGTVNNGQNVAIDLDDAGNREGYVVTGAGSATATLSLANASAVTEGGTMQFIVTRTGNSGSVVSVNYATSSGTASVGSDFNAASGTLTFQAGEMSKTFNVTTIDDSAVESTEYLNASLSGPSAGAALGTSTATGNINDNDVAGSTISIASASVTEGGVLQFQVTRSGNTASAVSVSYASSSNTAVAGSDFYGVSGTLSFASGVTTQTINVSTIEDSAVESTETLTMTLSNPQPSGVTISTSSAAGAILDNDTAGGGIIVPSGYLASTVYGGYTGIGGNGAGMRDGVYTGSASVIGTSSGSEEWVRMDLGSVQAVGNVVLVPISSTFDGWGYTYLNQAALERSNDGSSWTTVVASISGASDGAQMQIPVNTSTRFLRVKRAGYLGLGDFYATTGGGGGGSASLSISNASVTEGGTLQFTVTRSGTTTSAVSASFATSSGSATSGSDFYANSGTVSFAAGVTSQTINVATIDDSSVESSETMSVTLSSPSSGATIGTATGSGTINDNDVSAAVLSISGASTTEGGTLSFAVTRSGNMSNAVSASFATSGGSATSGSDFYGNSSTVSFASGVTTQYVTVTTIDDSSVEGTETMTVSLSNPSSGATIGTAAATGTILDNDTGGGGGNILIPSSYTYSSNYGGYTGTSGNGAGMRDSIYDTSASIHGTNSGTNEWIVMDLGSVRSITNVVVAPASANAPGGWGAQYLNGTAIDLSNDNSSWTTAHAGIGASVDGVPISVGINASARYVRLRKPSGYLGVGDFYATGPAQPTVITPSSYFASSSYQSYDGLSGNGPGMRDGVYDTGASIHGTAYGSDQYVTMDLGSSQSVGNVVVVPASASAPGGWGAGYLNGAYLQRSTDNANWTYVATVSSSSDGVQVQVPVNASTRYLRLLRPGTGYIGVGDFFARTP